MTFASLVCAFAIGAAGLLPDRASVSGRPAPCAPVTPAHVGHITAVPPHRIWPHLLRNSSKYSEGLVPMSADGGHVLVAEYQKMSREDRRVPLAIFTSGGRLRPIPRSEFPPLQLQTARIEYPWVVGISAFQHPPADWTLWAANVVTGRHLILDHGNGVNARTQRRFPDFALNGHRIVWTDAASRDRVLWNRLDLYNLDTGRQTVIASTGDGRTVYTHPTLWGNTVVSGRLTERGRGKRPANNLVLVRLGSRKVIALTDNRPGGMSTQPSLWRHYLLFTQQDSTFSQPRILLWDLSKKHFPLRQGPGATLLDARGGGMAFWDGGVAVWAAHGQENAAVYIPRTGRVRTFQDRALVGRHGHTTYAWEMTGPAEGGTLVIKRSIWSTYGDPTYFVVHFPLARGRLCR